MSSIRRALFKIFFDFPATMFPRWQQIGVSISEATQNFIDVWQSLASFIFVKNWSRISLIWN